MPRRKKPEDPRARIEDQLVELETKLARSMGKKESESAAESVEHCALQTMAWKLRGVLASIRTREEPDDRSARNDLKTASQQAQEWQKRKDAAMVLVFNDKLEDILRRLEDMEQAGDLLEEIET